MAYAFTDWEGTCLAHHGIKGQKWGVRRYQNDDGTLTALGKLRGGHEARKENRSLKKTLKDDKKYSKEWRKEKKNAIKRAVKDDDYRKSIANLEAHRLKMDPEETKEWMDAYLAGERAADNIIWYKYGNRGYKNTVNKSASGEKIAKSVLKKLEKRGVDVAANGRRWQSKFEEEAGLPRSGKNMFEGKPAHYTLSLLQDQRKIENKRKRKERKIQRSDKIAFREYDRKVKKGVYDNDPELREIYAMEQRDKKKRKSGN